MMIQLQFESIQKQRPQVHVNTQIPFCHTNNALLYLWIIKQDKLVENERPIASHVIFSIDSKYNIFDFNKQQNR